MKTMPRVTTFLRNIQSYHTFHPSEKDTEQSKKQPKVTFLYSFQFMEIEQIHFQAI